MPAGHDEDLRANAAGASGERAGLAPPALPRNAGEMLAMARNFLERKELGEARLDAELLVAHALGLTRLGLYLDLARPLQGSEIDLARDLLVRRGRREPLAYITGEREFYGRNFRVGPGVLIPRPESEHLVDRAREILRQRGSASPAHVLDFGTGSGNLAITLALEVPGTRLLALDCSGRALSYAELNAERLGVQLQFLCCDGLEPAREQAPFDLIVSNPPYIERGESAELLPEVRDYEPDEALFAPPGESDYWLVRLLSFARECLTPSGALLVELGHRQGARAAELCVAQGLKPTLYPDLARHLRVLEARR